MMCVTVRHTLMYVTISTTRATTANSMDNNIDNGKDWVEESRRRVPGVFKGKAPKSFFSFYYNLLISNFRFQSLQRPGRRPPFGQ